MVLVSIVIALAVIAVALAYRSHRHARRAEAGRALAEQRLYDSGVAKARALQLSRRIGQSVESLDAIREVAQLQPSSDLVDEAIASLALPDLVAEDTWHSIPSNVVAVAVSHSFNRFAWLDTSRTIGVHQMSDGSPTRWIRDVAPDAGQLWLTHDGGFVIVVSGRAVRPYHVNTGAPTRTFDTVNPSIAIHPTNHWVAFAAAANRIEVRSIPVGDLICSFETSRGASPLAFSPVSTRLAIAVPDSGVEIWDIDSRMRTNVLTGNAFRVNNASWSADGRFLALGVNAPYIYVWDTTTDNSRHVRGVPAQTAEGLRVLLHPQAHWVTADTGFPGFRLWNSWLAAELLSIPDMRPIGFSPDGNRLLVRGPNGVGVLRTVESDVVRTVAMPPGYSPDFEDAFTFSPNNQLLLRTGGDGTWAWSLDTHPMFHRLDPTWCWNIRFVARDQFISAGHKTLWRGTLDHCGTLIRRTDVLPGRADGLLYDDVSADGRYAVAHTGTGGAILSLNEAQPDVLLTNCPEASGFVFSPDHRWVASGARHDPSRSLRPLVWSAASGAVIARIPAGRTTVTFSPDSKWLLVGSTAEYQLFSTTSWKAVRRWPRFSSGGTAAAAFSADSRLVATHLDDHVVGINEVATGRTLFRLRPATLRLLRRLTFSSDGRWLAVGTQAHMQLWDLHRLGERISDLGLAWPLSKPSAPATVGFIQPAAPPALEQRLVILILCVALGALVFAVFLRRYQRRMLAAYMELDAVVTQRNAQLAQAQSDLWHSQKMRALGTLAAGVAHDFNNLLSVIRMANKLTGEESRDNSEVQENVALIDRTVAQGKAVVQSMLGYSRKEGERHLFPVNALVERTLKLLHKEFLSGVELDVNLDAAGPQVHGLPSRLEQVLLNLIVNAAEALHGKGALRLSTSIVSDASAANVLRPRGCERYVEIIVADTGIGMPSMVRERMFEPFFTTKNVGNQRGAGLGLSIAYTIAQEEGFGIGVESNEGTGTTIRLLASLDSPP